VSHIRSCTLKFYAPCSLSPHLVNFHPRALSRSSIVLETIMLPSPSVVLDLSPRACCRLVPSTGARHRLDPVLGACRCHPLPQAICAPSISTLLPSECATTVNLDPASLGACCRCPLPQALNMASCNAKKNNIERGARVDQKFDFLNRCSDGRSETADVKISLKRDRFTIHMLDSEVG
jgi:hypothetical protein